MLLEEGSALRLFGDMAGAFARRALPCQIADGLLLGRMTALKKEDDKVLGIVVGAVLSRLVGKAVAMHMAQQLQAATVQYEFALQTRAGTDALALAALLATDIDQHKVVASLDGVGAYDHIRRLPRSASSWPSPPCISWSHWCA